MSDLGARTLLPAGPPHRPGREAARTLVSGSSPRPAEKWRRGAGVAILAGVALGMAWWAGRVPATPPVPARLELSASSRERLRALAAALEGGRAIEELLTSTDPLRTPEFTRRRDAALAEAEEILRANLSRELLAELATSRLDLSLTHTLGRILLRLRLLHRERGDNVVQLGESELLARLEEVYSRVVRTRRIPELCDYPVGGDIDWVARRRAEEVVVQGLGGRWACRRSRADWPEYDLPTGVMRSGRLLKVNMSGAGFLPQAGAGASRMIADMFRGEKAADYRRTIELDQPEARIGPLRHPDGADLVIVSRTMGWDQTVQGVVEVVGEDSLEVVFAVPYEFFEPPETDQALHTARTGWALWVSDEVLPRGVELVRLRPVGVQALGPPQRTVSLELAWHHEGGEAPRVPGLMGPG